MVNRNADDASKAACQTGNHQAAVIRDFPAYGVPEANLEGVPPEPMGSHFLLDTSGASKRGAPHASLVMSTQGAVDARDDDQIEHSRGHEAAEYDKGQRALKLLADR